MSDSAQHIAFDAAAPEPERTAALAELQQAHMPSAADLAPAGYLKDFLDRARQDLMEDPFGKAINANIVPFPSTAAKKREPGMQSLRLDDWQVNIQGDYWERPSIMSFDAMRSVVNQTPILNAVILTRIRQVQRFCRVAESGNDKPGFEIRHIDRKHKLQKSEQESIQLLNRFMSNCGWEFSPRRRKALRRDSFSQFMAKATRDTLTLDAVPIELEWKRDKSLGFAGFYAVDGATVRLCTENGYQGDPDIQALQVVQGRISTAYTFDDLIYEARNPRSDVMACGYGLSEVELLVRVVTGYLNALTYNIKGFDSNSIPKGMLHLTGNYTPDDLAAFKRYWNAMVRGVNNAWTLPVMVSKDQESKASFEKFGVEFNEMYFSKWMTFLTSIICAIYGMSPAEINFDSFSGGNTSPLAGSDTSEKLAASKDSGLRPVLAYFENLFTDYLVQDFSDKYVFRWTGLDPDDADKKHEMRKLVLTVDEVRAEEGYEAHPNELLGGAPLNPSLTGLYQQATQPQPDPNDPAAGGAGADGDGPAPGDGPGDGQGEPQGGDQDAQGQGPDFGQPGDADFGKAFGLPVFRDFQ